MKQYENFTYEIQEKGVVITGFSDTSVSDVSIEKINSAVVNDEINEVKGDKIEVMGVIPKAPEIVDPKDEGKTILFNLLFICHKILFKIKKLPLLKMFKKFFSRIYNCLFYRIFAIKKIDYFFYIMCSIYF